MSFHPKTYPTIERALLPDVPDKMGDRRVRGRIKETDLERIAQHEKLELAANHMPGIEIMEIVRADESVYYEAVTGPNCSHLCAACRGEVNDDMREFGRGAIGVFGDTAGGEMERLRDELRLLVTALNKGIAPSGQLVGAAQAQLPAEKVPQAAIPTSVHDMPTRPTPWECSRCGSVSYWHFKDPPPNLTQEIRDAHPDLCAVCIEACGYIPPEGS